MCERSDLAVRDDRHQGLRIHGLPDGQVIRDGIPLLDNVDNADLTDIEDVVAHVLDVETRAHEVSTKILQRREVVKAEKHRTHDLALSPTSHGHSIAW